MQLLSIPIPNRRPTALAAAQPSLRRSSPPPDAHHPRELSDAQQGSDPDSTRAGAVSLGDITAQHRAKGKNHSIDGVNDVVDYFSFSLTATREVMVNSRRWRGTPTFSSKTRTETNWPAARKPTPLTRPSYTNWTPGPTTSGSRPCRGQQHLQAPVQGHRTGPGRGRPDTGKQPRHRSARHHRNSRKRRTLTADTQGISDQNGLTNPPSPTSG